MAFRVGCTIYLYGIYGWRVRDVPPSDYDVRAVKDGRAMAMVI